MVFEKRFDATSYFDSEMNDGLTHVILNPAEFMELKELYHDALDKQDYTVEDLGHVGGFGGLFISCGVSIPIVALHAPLAFLISAISVPIISGFLMGSNTTKNDQKKKESLKKNSVKDLTKYARSHSGTCGKDALASALGYEVEEPEQTTFTM